MSHCQWCGKGMRLKSNSLTLRMKSDGASLIDFVGDGAYIFDIIHYVLLKIWRSREVESTLYDKQENNWILSERKYCRVSLAVPLRRSEKT